MKDKLENKISVLELIYTISINSFLFALMINVVESSSKSIGHPPKYLDLTTFLSASKSLNLLLFPLITTSLFSGFIFLLLYSLPKKFQNKFRWKLLTKEDNSDSMTTEESLSAITPHIIAFLSLAMLVIAAFHVRSDRTNRIPVVTWEGFAAEYIDYLLWLGWTGSLMAIAGGYIAAFITNYELGESAVVLGFTNLCLWLFFSALIYED